MKFPIDRIPSFPILKFWDLGRTMAVGQNRLKIVNLECFHLHYEISERLGTIMLYIGNMGLWPDLGVGHWRK
jgi:hypothetical protein